MDLLDRHGQGLDEASSGGTPNTSITCAEVSNRYRGKDAEVASSTVVYKAPENAICRTYCP